MTWIETIPLSASEGRLRTRLERIATEDGHVDNIMLAHGLRPHTLDGHMALYKSVLHHPHNSIATWFLEAIGVYTSHLNGCAYCVEHHAAGMRRWLNDDNRSSMIRTAIESREFSPVFSRKEVAALAYVEKLTKSPASMSEAELESLRAEGWTDGEILEINQVASYFAYANRTVLGLGVRVEVDSLGLSPSETDDPNAWGHN